MSSRAICWVRRDLRLYDHAALAAATEFAAQVAVVFVFDTQILDALADRDDRRLSFIHRSLAEMDATLRAAGSQLFVLHGDPIAEIPRLAERLGVQAVFTARDVEPYAQTRDGRVAESLAALNIDFQTVRDTVVIESDQVASQAGTPFRVYTPFSRAWRAAFEPGRDDAEVTPNLGHLLPPDPTYDLPELSAIGFTETDLWVEPGEAAGRRQLAIFADRIARYATERDFPANDATSVLSPHFRFGTVSIRDAVRIARRAGSAGEKWYAELIWREFYQYILFHFPHVVDRPFQPQYEGMVWPGEEAHWEAWCTGHTGYPIVDAAMRCFNATGWMHNRLRMVVASFLTKDLLLDYRRGEAYFARYLLDFDLASNNGGWQWAASTGCDAQPYFRIFNPVLQSRKFDPTGAFLREWIPELCDLDLALLHAPWEASPMERLAMAPDYPAPIVDHAAQKMQALALFQRT